ncbi:cation:proton antiporter [Actinospica robiniae]|uniref:cation:proton antiporter n=1 Tax=Actinospica robiniae TaxID=304901 RepID=UPI0004175410|nr:cation:proton antiporter [Actinospica robiniae]
MPGAGAVLALVLTSTLVATFADRWSVPAPSVLVLAGIGVAVIPGVVFALIGLQLPALVGDLPPGTGWWPVQAVVLAVTLIAVRLAWMRPTVSLAEPTRHYPAWPATRVMTWAGTRGVMPLAAALSIPLADASGHAATDRPLVLVLTASVVALTLSIQGLTLSAVVRACGLS